MSKWRPGERDQELNHMAELGLKDGSLGVIGIKQIKKIRLFGFQSWLYCLLWRLGQVN